MCYARKWDGREGLETDYRLLKELQEPKKFNHSTKPTLTEQRFLLLLKNASEDEMLVSIIVGFLSQNSHL